MAVIGGNQIKSIKQIRIPIIAKALKDNGFHVTVPKDQGVVPKLIVKEYQLSLEFIFNEKYGGNVRVNNKKGQILISGYRTMKTLTEAVVRYFVRRRKVESDLMIDAYKAIQSEDPGLKKYGKRRLAMLNKRLGKEGRTKYIKAIAKKQMKKEEENEKPTLQRYKWGYTFNLANLSSLKSPALIAGKDYERKRHVCFIETFGELPTCLYALYVSRSVLSPNAKNPYKLKSSSDS